MKKQLVAALIGVNMSAVAQAATPSMEEMWQLIQQQQSEIAALKSQLNKSNSRITETEVMTEATISAVEKLSLAPTSSATTFGGYGEMHYNNLERDDGGDDEEAEKYRYSRTGSDIQMPPVSDDEDAEKLRHIQAEKERKQMRK